MIRCSARWIGRGHATTAHDDHDHDHAASTCDARALAAPCSRRARHVVTTFRVAELDCATEERELRDVARAPRRRPRPVVRPRRPPRDDRPHARRHRAARRGDPRRRDARRRGRHADGHRRAPALPRRVLVTDGRRRGPGRRVGGRRDRRPRRAVAARRRCMAGAAIALGGRDTLRKGFRALLARRLTMALLMSVAVVGAVAIGQWPEAAVVIWLFGLAELIEALSLERARDAIRSLVALAPETARVRTATACRSARRPTWRSDAVIVVRPGRARRPRRRRRRRRRRASTRRRSPARASPSPRSPATRCSPARSTSAARSTCG